MTEENKPDKVIENVYVATVFKDKIALFDRSYRLIEEIPSGDIPDAAFLLQSVCICQRTTGREDPEEGSSGHHRDVKGSTSYWFCQDKKTGKYAKAELWKNDESAVGTQVVMTNDAEGACGKY